MSREVSSEVARSSIEWCSVVLIGGRDMTWLVLSATSLLVATFLAFSSAVDGTLLGAWRRNRQLRDDDDKEGLGGLTASRSSVIRLDETRAVQRGDRVLAVFPDTTSFYLGVVHRVRKHRRSTFFTPVYRLPRYASRRFGRGCGSARRVVWWSLWMTGSVDSRV